MFEILKFIFIFFLGILALSKIAKEIKNDFNKNYISNVIGIAIIILLTFFIYKI